MPSAKPTIHAVTVVASSNDAQTTSAVVVIRALIESAKPGIARMVGLTALVAFIVVALGNRSLDVELFLTAIGCGVGTIVAAGGANALNMWMEGDRDRVMHRTASRPIPSGRLSDTTVLIWGTTLVALGVAILLISTNPIAAGLALVSAASYLFLYTPLKPRSPWCTVVGALPGALPTLIGAAAASTYTGVDPLLEPVGLATFAMLFTWQMPHFFALAWMYRDDYEKGGMQMLTVVDSTGRRAGRASVIWALALIPASISPAFATDLLGWPFVLIAFASSTAFFVRVWLFAKTPADASARRVFFASIMHLPLLMAAMLVESLFRVVFM